MEMAAAGAPSIPNRGRLDPIPQEGRGGGRLNSDFDNQNNDQSKGWTNGKKKKKGKKKSKDIQKRKLISNEELPVYDTNMDLNESGIIETRSAEKSARTSRWRTTSGREIRVSISRLFFHPAS